MRDYQKGKIYKIASYKTSLVYIGSTVQELSSRMSGHRKKHRSYQTGNKDYTSSFEILAYGDAKIVLVESFSCNSKYELEKRERYWIEQTECVNRYTPTRTQKERYQDNKEHYRKKDRQYEQANQEKIRARKKQYYKDNKEKITQHSQTNREHIRVIRRERYQANRERLVEKQGQYYQDNRDEINMRSRFQRTEFGKMCKMVVNGAVGV